ncbi:aldo/keto reductase [Carnobacterium gallinarum]|uniref:aldo/keto reductase n=1 Tax=Carnobacterium gallinarum TaxID=2749 RepID=UPI00068C5669|nr:aldo/keto reductase [Carnobacterium gallinarum]
MVVSLLDRMPLNNGLTIPGIGLGTYGMDDNQVEETVFTALMNGYRLIDTASMYKNEVGVGRGINRAINAGISREDIFVVTKIWKTDAGLAKATQAFEDSFQKLNLEYVDMALIHWPDASDEINRETWQALEEIYASGRVKAIGVANFTRGDLLPLLKAAKIKPVVNQIEIYPGHRLEELTDFCASKNIVTMAYSPLKKGKLSSENKITKIAEKHNKTVAQIALRWSIEKDLIPIPKTTHKERLIENAAIFDFELSDEEMDILDNLG